MYSLIRDRAYNDAKIVCSWDAVPIAHVYFAQSGYHLSSSNTTEASSSPTAGTLGGSGNNNLSSLTTITTTNTNVTLLDAVVTPIFVFDADSETLTIPGVFITSILALKGFAFRPNTDIVPTYTGIAPVEEGDASMVFELYQIRTRPPFLEYRWLIEAVRQLPAFLVQQSRFAETGIGIFVDGVHVGDGLLQKFRPAGLVQKAGEVMVGRV